MPVADSADQAAARAYEASLRSRVFSGQVPRSELDSFLALPKKVRRSRRLIAEALGPQKDALERAQEEAERAMQARFESFMHVPSNTGRPVVTPLHTRLPPALRPLSPTSLWLLEGSGPLPPRSRASTPAPTPFPPPVPSTPEAPGLWRSLTILPTPPSAPASRLLPARDLSCLQRDGSAWQGLGRRKRRCRVFHAIGSAYMRHQQLENHETTSVTTPPAPISPPAPVQVVEVAPEPVPVVSLPPPKFPTTPAELAVLEVDDRVVNKTIAYIVALGRYTASPQQAYSLRDAAIDIQAEQRVCPGLLSDIVGVLCPRGLDGWHEMEPSSITVLDFVRGWFTLAP